MIRRIDLHFYRGIFQKQLQNWKFQLKGSIKQN